MSKNPSNQLQHLAIIMDGNSRWSDSLGLHKFFGYSEGAKNLKDITKITCNLGIKYLTLYAFSTENWNRPEGDINYLLELLENYLDTEIEELHQNNIKLKFIGSISKLSEELKSKVQSAESLTSNNHQMQLNIAFSYGGRQEIVDACQKIIDAGEKFVTAEIFAKYLYCPQIPDVDLLIRTGKEKRLSNFLLWQTSYTELFFSDKYWPEFTESDLINAIEDYKTRKRNFGGLR